MQNGRITAKHHSDHLQPGDLVFHRRGAHAWIQPGPSSVSGVRPPAEYYYQDLSDNTRELIDQMVGSGRGAFCWGK